MDARKHGITESAVLAILAEVLGADDYLLKPVQQPNLKKVWSRFRVVPQYLGHARTIF